MPQNPLRIDPSRTLTLRRTFTQWIRKVFSNVISSIRRLIFRDDAFGTEKERLPGQQWKDIPLAGKIDRFKQWVSGEMNHQVLGQQQQAQIRRYIEQAYQKGILRAYADIRRDAVTKEGISSQEAIDAFRKTKEQFAVDTMRSPTGHDRIDAQVKRTVAEIQGATDAMTARMVRRLHDSLAKEENRREITEGVIEDTDYAKHRSEVTARTEIIRAHADGQLLSMEALDKIDVSVQVEWSASGEACPLCAEMDGQVFTLIEARGLIPRHPNCLCVLIPTSKDKSWVRRSGR